MDEGEYSLLPSQQHHHQNQMQQMPQNQQEIEESNLIRNSQQQSSTQQQQQQQQLSQTPKYAQLLAVLEEMGKDIRPNYAGSKSSGERLKRSIVHARILVRECLMETERASRNQ